MKFDYVKSLSNYNYSPEYHFKFSLSENDIIKVIHKYGNDQKWISDVFDYPSPNPAFQMYAAIRILQDVTREYVVDLGINYKEKYEELENLLEPHKIEDNMSPATTLKMILKYHK